MFENTKLTYFFLDNKIINVYTSKKKFQFILKLLLIKK
jgi:hypothetical protein